MKESETTDITIDKARLAQMPTVVFEGTIEVIDTPERASEALASIPDRTVVGFDTETKPSFKKGQTNTVSLMQVSMGDRCLLIRLNRIGFTEAVRDFLQRDSITKIGLSVKDDFNALRRLGAFEPRSFVELQQLAHANHIADSSLQKIYAIIFGHRISKGQRLTNWDADTLTEGQCRYASTDAWACERIYHTLVDGKFDHRAALRAVSADTPAASATTNPNPPRT